jgi:O-antigen/teichoic acid export membrane protein
MRSNLAAGLTSSIWSAAVGLAVVPLYLRYLGLEGYGLIGILVTAQTLFSLLDLGMAPALNREVARCSATGALRPARELLHTLSRIYWLTAAGIAAIAILLAPLVARHWLQSAHLPQESLSRSVGLIGAVIACRWPVGLYLGALIGAQRVVLSSTITIAMSTAANLGAVAVLVWISQSIEAYFLWQGLVGVLYALAMRSAAWRVVGREPGIAFSMSALARIWRFSAGIGFIALSALLLTQVDKIVLSRVVSLSDFGRYSLATLVASALYLFITPTFNVIYPRFVALIAEDNEVGLIDLYRRGMRLFSMALFPIAMLVALFAEDFVALWTGDARLAVSIAPVIAMLAVGSALHGVMYFPYALQLAHGMIRLPLTISVSLVAIAAPLMAALAWRYGIKGGAAAWLLLHVLYVLLGTWLTHRVLLKRAGIAWFCQDVATPLVVSLAVGAIGNWILDRATWAIAPRAMLGAAMLVGAWALSIVLAPRFTLPPLRRLLSTRGAT